MTMTYYEVVPPTKWQAGTAGGKPFYFSCADCGMAEPEIAGCLASGTDTERIRHGDVGIITSGPRGARHAMFCAHCLRLRMNPSPLIWAALIPASENQVMD